MPKHDPYMRDPNIRKAANMQRIAWPVLGSAVGAAVSAWFQFSIALGVGVGAVVGVLAASAILSTYGGRSTR